MKESLSCSRGSKEMIGAVLVELLICVPIFLLLLSGVIGLGFRFIEDQAVSMALTAATRGVNTIWDYRDIVSRNNGYQYEGGRNFAPDRVSYVNSYCQSAIYLAADQIKRLNFDPARYCFRAQLRESDGGRELFIRVQDRPKRADFAIRWLSSTTTREAVVPVHLLTDEYCALLLTPCTCTLTRGNGC